MLLSFPCMHLDLASPLLPDSTRFFDPGMAQGNDDRMFRPDDLPMDRQTATALINDCINFGEQFKDPGEMAYFGAVTSDDFYEGSSLSIQAQLSRQFDDGQGAKQERERKEAASRAQFILLLAWFFEEKMLELNSIEQGIKDSWTSMDKAIGVDEEDRMDERVLDLGKRESHTGGASDEQCVALPWKRILESLPAFIPAEAVLVCTDQDIIAVWEDMEIPFETASKERGLPADAQVATLPAWKLAGRNKAPVDMPHALHDITVAVVR